MPIFEYTCEECGNTFEEIVIGQSSEVTCPKCSSAKTKRLLSASRFKVKSGVDGPITMPNMGGRGGGCSGCSGGDCSSC